MSNYQLSSFIYGPFRSAVKSASGSVRVHLWSWRREGFSGGSGGPQGSEHLLLLAEAELVRLVQTGHAPISSYCIYNEAKGRCPVQLSVQQLVLTGSEGSVRSTIDP